MTSRVRRISEKSNGSKMDDSTRSAGRGVGLTEIEYFWSIELNADNKTYTWMNDEDLEDGDEEFIEHTVFIKSAVLGANAVSGESNVVMMESHGDDMEKIKGAIVHLTRGQNNMTGLDLTMSSKVGPTTFTLVEGSGPVFISGNKLMEYPQEDDQLDASQTESEEEETEEEEMEGEEEDDKEKEKEKEKEATEPDAEEKKAVKRKAGPIAGKPKQKAKMEVEKEEEEEEEDEEDEDEEEQEEESEEEESEEEVKVKKTAKKGKGSGKKETPKAKPAPAKKAKKPAKK